MSTPTGSATKTLLLGGTNTADNRIGGNLSNLTSGGNTSTLAVTKYGAGTWLLGGTNTYTGNTTIAQGTLKTTSSFPAWWQRNLRELERFRWRFA